MLHSHNLKNLRTILDKIDHTHRSVFLVAGNHIRRDQDIVKRLKNLCGQREIIWQSGIKSHPTIRQAKKIITACERAKPGLIVAIGGASVLDMAKLAVIFKTAAELEIFIKLGKMPTVKSALPVVAIPTIFGSGSESTPYAVVYDAKKKYSITHPLILPQVVISDPSLGLTASKAQIASTGLDCVAEAMEALWSTRSTIVSDKFGSRALRLALVAVPRVFAEPTNVFWQKKLAVASYAVGQAIAMTRTTAPHAFSYPLSIHYQIPHGAACSLTLDLFLKYNSAVTEVDCLDLRGFQFVRSRINKIAKLICGRNDVPAASRAISALKKKLNIPIRLRDWGVKQFDESKLLSNDLNPERLGLNPRRVTIEDAKGIYARIF